MGFFCGEFGRGRWTAMLLCVAVAVLAGSGSSSSGGLSPKDEIGSGGKQIVVDYRFPSPSLEVSGGQSRLEMSGLSVLDREGKPIVPYKTGRILLPPSGSIDRIDVTASGQRTIPGEFKLELGRAPQPTNARVLPGAGASSAAFVENEPYPGPLYELASVQNLRGYRIAILRLFPVQYLATKGEISYCERLTVAVTVSSVSGDGVKATRPSTFRGHVKDEAKARQTVDNPDLLKAYPRPDPERWKKDPRLSQKEEATTASENPASCEYLIITKASYVSEFEPLLNWKMQKGLTGRIATVEEIKESTEGEDLQEQIRNFIRDCYQNQGTEYVLLGGDTEVIPFRGAYGEVGAYIDEGIPCDLYYGCLDGSWDHDGDGLYGEGDDGEGGEEIDLIAEVYVGRAPASSPREVEYFVNKTLSYEVHRSPNLADALWLGQVLDSKTWGSDSKEELVIYLPESFEVNRLYQKKGTFTTSAVIAALDNSPHIVNHLGHSTQVMLLGLMISDVDDLDNTHPFFLYSQGCDAGAFDYDDSIAEHFVKNRKGAFAVIANSRYGWYAPETTLGTSQAFDREFLKAVFSEDITNLGKALQGSKEANIGDVLQTGATRWCYFELNLLGDPETALFTATRQGELTMDRSRYSPKTPIALRVADIDLNANALVTETAMITLSSPGDTEIIFALETDSNSGVFVAEVPLSTGPPEFDGVLQVKDAEQVTATYEDAHDGSGTPQVVTATAVIDDSPPTISNVTVVEVRDIWAVIEWQTNEPSTARVEYGVSPAFGSSSSSDVISKTHRVIVGGLEKETTYVFRVIAIDVVGNETTDENGGEYYAFETKHQLLVFADDVEEGGAAAAGEWPFQVVSGRVGDWAITTDDFRSETACWYTDDYPYPSANVLDTPLIDLRGMTGAHLLFWHRMLSETDWDGGFVQVQRDGMEEWSSLTQEEMMEGTPYVTLSTGNPSGALPGWSGDIPWERVIFDLSGFVGERIRIRFRMESDDNTDAGEGDGWYIDDVSVLRAMGTVNLDKLFYRLDETVSITVLDADANTDPEVVEEVSVEAVSRLESVPETVTLTEAGPDSWMFVGQIVTAKKKTANDGELAVFDNDTITVSYANGESATAATDLRLPSITNVQSAQVADSSALIRWRTNEACRGAVYYGTDPANLSGTLHEVTQATQHEVLLVDLELRTPYYFKVDAIDRAGNSAIDDNDGELYRFLTLGFSQAGVIAEDTVWRYADGHPYVVSGSLYVGTGNGEKPVTLTIEPGVVVQFKTDKRHMFIRGGIVARGVTFEFDVPSGKTAHLIFEEGSSGIIDSSVITVTEPSNEMTGGIECYSSNITFTNNIVRNAYYGFHCLSSSPEISGNTFIICNYGVFLHAAAGRHSSPIVAKNTFIGCRYPLFCEPRGYPAVKDNVFSGNDYDGLVHSAIMRDAIWPAYDCPHLITSDLTVPLGKTLMISPGATVRFVEGGADLLVSGSLEARGATIEFAVPTEPHTVISFDPTSSGSIQNCRIVGENPNGGPAGGIKCLSSAVSITNNVISNTYYGVFSGGQKSPLIANNTITGCGFGVYAPDATPTLINCILWNNGADLMGCSGTYLNTTGGEPGEGNISLDPLFRDAMAGDFRLLPGSPCIDSGTSRGSGVLDARGYLRYDDPDTANTGGGALPYFDIGAYEFVFDGDEDLISDEWEIRNGLNPFDKADASEDADGDGKTNREEHISGTDPNIAASLMQLVEVLPIQGEGGGIVLGWSTVSERNYRVFYADEFASWRGKKTSSDGNMGLSDLTIWKPCSMVMKGTGEWLWFFDEGGTNRTTPLDPFIKQRFYRVEVE